MWNIDTLINSDKMDPERQLLISKLKKEESDLSGNITRLSNALNNAEMLDIIDPPHIPLLKIQLAAMETYRQCLKERIKLLYTE